MFRSLLIFLIWIIFHPLMGQEINDSVQGYHFISLNDQRANNRYVFTFTPNLAKNFYGLSVGLFGSEIICNKGYTQHSSGLNVQLLGQGFFQVFMIGYLRSPDSLDALAEDSRFGIERVNLVPDRVDHSGLLLSTFGTYTDRISGASISGWMSSHKIVKGFSFNLLWNNIRTLKGVCLGLFNTIENGAGLQLGLFNVSSSARGIQIGLWNKNEKRSLPVLNWYFGRKDKKKDGLIFGD